MKSENRLLCCLAAAGLTVLTAAVLVGPTRVRGAVACATNEDCDDGNPCTNDACDSTLGCVTSSNTGAFCNDGDPCTGATGDVCNNGSCSGALIDCDDQNPCTDDACDSAGNSFLCTHDPNGSCTGNCGNGVIDPGETCDPPGSASGAHNLPCRADCTVCGDGVTQPPETCDDGNTVSGCRPDKPQKPLDGCLNSCTQPLCDDPAKIRFGTSLDLVAVHGRLVTGAALAIANEHFVVQLTDGSAPADSAAVIFRTSLVKGSLTQSSATAFKYKNRAAKEAGGIYTLKINGKDGYYKFTMKAYGNVVGAQSDMRTHVFIGSDEWRVRGQWQQLATGWLLTKKATFLQP